MGSEGYREPGSFFAGAADFSCSHLKNKSTLANHRPLFLGTDRIGFQEIGFVFGFGLEIFSLGNALFVLEA